MTTNSGGNMALRMNGVTTSSYSRHSMYGFGSTGSVTSTSSTSQTSMQIYGDYAGQYMLPASGIVDILDYASSSKNKTVKALSGSIHALAAEIALGSGAFLSTSAITSITMLTNSGAFSSASRYSLYGIKG
jgi:hypothetical protein